MGSDSKIVDVTCEDSGRTDLAGLSRTEAGRRDRDRGSYGDLAQLEKTYFGREVGHIRRAFNTTMMRHMRTGGALLDYGCGGAWWKEDYWPLFDSVTACEIDRSALEEIAAHYPETRLWWTRNGLAESDQRFDVVLSSSVLGYIHPDQAAPHLTCAHTLLRDGGQLVLTRVLAFDLIAFLKWRRLVELPGGSFAYHYGQDNLKTLLQNAGFRDIRYVNLGIRFPCLSWKMNQWLYKAVPFLMTVALPIIFPILRIEHMLVASK